MHVKKLRAYTGSFGHGIRVCLSDRADFISMIVIYSTLMAVFFHIFKIMPMHELGRPDLTWHHLFQYVLVTELVLLSVQGHYREFGSLIAEGQLTVMMQRPHSLLGLWLVRVYGSSAANMALMSVLAFWIIPVIAGVHLDMDPVYVPLFVVSIGLSMLIFLILSYCVCMVEIFGPYSRPLSWMVNKTVFTLGGLFFPLIFFPDTFRMIVHLTPAPAILFTPGSFMLHSTTVEIARGMVEQVMWVAILLGVAHMLEKKLVAYVLTHGD